MRPIIVLAHGILTRQTVASWPDQFHSWLELELHGANANVLKKEYIAGPFPLWNVLVKNRLLARGLAAEVALFFKHNEQQLAPISVQQSQDAGSLAPSGERVRVRGHHAQPSSVIVSQKVSAHDHAWPDCEAPVDIARSPLTPALSPEGTRESGRASVPSTIHYPPSTEPLTPHPSPLTSAAAATTPPLHFIAHSNGTDVALKAIKLLAARGIVTDTFIAIGSVLPSDIERNGVLDLLLKGHLRRAIAYASLRDYAIRVGQHTIGYGGLGRHGWTLNVRALLNVTADLEVRTPSVIGGGQIFTRRFDDFGHGSYFDPEHREQTFALIARDCGLAENTHDGRAEPPVSVQPSQDAGSLAPSGERVRVRGHHAQATSAFVSEHTSAHDHACSDSEAPVDIERRPLTPALSPEGARESGRREEQCGASISTRIARRVEDNAAEPNATPHSSPITPHSR